MANGAKSFMDELSKVFTMVSNLELLPDADLPLVTSLKESIVAKFRQPEQAAQADGTLPLPGQNPAGLGAPGDPLAALGGGGLPGGAPPPGLPGLPGLTPGAPPPDLGAGGGGIGLPPVSPGVTPDAITDALAPLPPNNRAA